MLHRRSRFHVMNVMMVPGSLPAILLALGSPWMTHDPGKNQGYPPWNDVFPPSFSNRGVCAVSFREKFSVFIVITSHKKKHDGKIETLSFIQVSISIKPPCVQINVHQESFLFTMPKKAVVLWEIHCLIPLHNPGTTWMNKSNITIVTTWAVWQRPWRIIPLGNYT